MKIILKRFQCISCGSCAAVCPEYFEMADDNLSHIKGSSVDTSGNEVLEVGEEKIGCAKEAAEICPVQIIEIT